jgi:hypothetical protein
MNMTTSIDNIPLKTTKVDNQIDDSEDPMVKDILNEFEQELKVNVQQTQQHKPPQNDYVINYPQQPQQQMPPQQSCQIPFKKPKPNNSYYNEELLRKSAIIVVIIAFVFSPIIFTTVLDKLPESMRDLVDSNNYYIKLILSFIAIYLLFHYNLI